MSEQILTERRGPVLHLRLHRPEKKNALTLEMYTALAEELHGAEQDPEIRAVLFSGVGDAFTGGNDLRDFLERPPRTRRVPCSAFWMHWSARRGPSSPRCTGWRWESVPRCCSTAI